MGREKSMEEKKYKNRLFDKRLEFYLRSVGAVLITGPKFCGKSTTALRYAKTVVDLTKSETRDHYISLAKAAPSRFLAMGEKPMLIDEWQVISFIWNDIKAAISESSSFGQYILTGSVTDNTKGNEDEFTHTGTGRILPRMMRTFSLFESGESSGEVSLSRLKEGDFLPCVSDKTIEDYAFYICRGGWPLSLDKERDVALQQAVNFYEGTVTKDMFSLRDVPLRKNEGRCRRLFRSYARHLASQASDEEIRSDMKEGMDGETFSKYLLAMERLHVSDELEAWNPNLRSKTAIRSKSTRYFVDPSVATSALGLSPEGLFKDMRTFGFLFESLVIRDLQVYCSSIDAALYHYRDKAGREADAVIKFRDGDWALIEAKMGDFEDIDLAAGKLLALSEDIDEEKPKPAFLMIITQTSLAYRREDGVYVVPLACLRE